MTTCYHESNLNAIAEGAWTLMMIDQDDRQTIAWAAGEIDRLRGEVASLRALLLAVDNQIFLAKVRNDVEESRPYVAHLSKAEADAIARVVNGEGAPPC